MAHVRGGIVLALIGATCVWIASCAPPPSSDDVDLTLSEAILRPNVTCEELRESFGIEDLTPVNNPAEAGLPYEEYFVATDDGEQLRVWSIPADQDRGLVVISPGAVGPMECSMYPGLLLHEHGWSVVIYDYRGFGGSTGSPSLRALPGDLEHVVDWARAHTGREQVSLLGTSVGSIPSAAVAVQRPDAVNAVVFDSPVALGLEIRRFRRALGGLTDLVITTLDPQLLTEGIISRMGEPLLVFLHEEDEVTPAASVEKLYDEAGGPKQLVRFPGLDHARGQFFRTQEFVTALDGFLAQVWGD